MGPDYTEIVPFTLFLAWIAGGVYMMVMNYRLFRYVRESHNIQPCVVFWDAEAVSLPAVHL